MAFCGALEGLRVLDISTMFSAPLAATLLGDFGADVIKIEHPRGDPLRRFGPRQDDVALWWKVVSRNKRAMTLDLKHRDGREVFLRLAERSDVVVENFRPGTLERWNLGFDLLSERNPKLILARLTGFGQTGPMAGQPGFGTLAEAMSGLAHATGAPDGPPTLPPFTVADGAASLATAFAVLTAVQARERTGLGQVIDLAIIEPILTVLGPHVTVFEQLGIEQQRTDNRSANNAPRNVYRTADDHWVAVAAGAQSVAERVLRLVGRSDLVEQPWFATSLGRVAHVEELDEAVATWIGSRRRATVLEVFAEAGAAAAPIYSSGEISGDPQYRALDTFIDVADPELGTIRLQNVMFRLSATPGRIEQAGAPLGAHTDEVLGELGFDLAARDALRDAGAV